MIEINNRKAEIVKVYSKGIWRLRFIDNLEIINIFYSLENKWHYC